MQEAKRKPGNPAKIKPVMPPKKPSIYEKVLDETEKLDFDQAAGVDGIDDEITLLRVKIAYILEKNPTDMQLLMRATDVLAKLVKTRYNMNKKQEKNLGEAIKNVIKDIGVPLGVALITKKLGGESSK